MRGIHGIAGLFALGIVLVGWLALAWPQSNSGKPAPTDPPISEPALGPLTLPGSVPANAADQTREPAPSASNSITRQEPAVSLEWEGPSAVEVGRQADYTLRVRNTGAAPVQQVLVRVQPPAGMMVRATQPKANEEEQVLWWDLDTLAVKQEKSLRIQMVSRNRGNTAGHAWVTFTGSAALRVTVNEPRLSLKVTAPEQGSVGENVSITVAVSNPGDASAEQVKLHTSLSEGFEYPGGKEADIEVGTLAAGETRNVQMICAVKSPGEHHCEALAEGRGDLRAKDRANVRIVQPRLDLEATGPKLRYLDRKAVYSFKITNRGDGPATDVMVNEVIPAGFKFTSASAGGRLDPATSTVSWSLGEVGAAQTREVQLEVVAMSPGEHHHKITAQGARGLTAGGDLVTRVEGLPTILVEVKDTEDPIEVGATTTYQVRITNTGSKPETDLKLTCVLPEQLEFAGATGATSFQRKGKEIIFESLPELPPRKEVLYRVTAKALAAGDAPLKAQITSTNLMEPVVEMESTHIYQD